jgi:hypothetical protein
MCRQIPIWKIFSKRQNVSTNTKMNEENQNKKNTDRVLTKHKSCDDEQEEEQPEHALIEHRCGDGVWSAGIEGRGGGGAGGVGRVERGAAPPRQAPGGPTQPPAVAAAHSQRPGPLAAPRRMAAVSLPFVVSLCLVVFSRPQVRSNRDPSIFEFFIHFIFISHPDSPQLLKKYATNCHSSLLNLDICFLFLCIFCDLLEND